MAFVAAMTVNAQVLQLNAESLGITDTDTGNDVAANTAWGSIDGAISVFNAFDTKHKPVNCKNDDFEIVKIDGAEILTAGGVQGQDNPKDADGGNSAVTLKEQTSGAVIGLKAEKDGWVYIVAKLSTNKQYVVFEEGAAIGYKIAMENLDERVKDGVLNLEITGTGEYNNVTLEDRPDGIGWVIREYTGDPEAATAGNGLGVLYFPVAAGCSYLASATGSKISWSGIYFSENEAQSITVEGEGISKALVGEGGGVTPTPVENHIYSVIGTILGNWDVDTDMEYIAEGDGYTALFENVAAGNYEFKIRQDHDWTVNWGVDGKQDGDNLQVSVAYDDSKIVISFRPSTGEIAAVVIDGEKPTPVPAGEGQAIQLDAESLGITDTDTGNDVAANTAWGSIDGAISVFNAFDTKHKPVNCKNDDFEIVNIDGTEILTAGGVQGQDNPKDADGGNSAVTLKEQTSGAVIGLKAEKDGWVYIVAKLSTNKQYVVFEEGAAIGYKIAMENLDERVKDGVLNLEITGTGEYNNVTLEDRPDGIGWVIREYTGDPEAATAGNGLGVLYFPVAAGCTYLASATGSKISWSGIYFSETEAANVTLAKADGTTLAIVGNGGTAIQSVKTAKDNDGAIYNIAGQKVSASYKGLVIKNGKKYILK